MSLYRQARGRHRRWIAVGILIAVAAGLVIVISAVGGDGGEGSPDAGELGAGAERMSSAIELVELHYGRSVADGEVVDEPLYSSVNDQLAAAIAELARLSPAIREESPAADRRISAAVSRLEDAIAGFDPAARVERLGARARGELAALAG